MRTARALERLPETSAAMARGALSFAKVRALTRTFSVFPGDDGMYVVRGRLDPEVGALLMRAIEAAGDVLYRKERAEAGAPLPEATPEPEPTPEQRRADALGLLAERALAVGFGDGPHGGTGAGAEGAAGGRPAPLSGARAERYQVVLHVEGGTLERTGEPGRSELESGTRVAAEPSGLGCRPEASGGAARPSSKARRNVAEGGVRRLGGGGAPCP